MGGTAQRKNGKTETVRKKKTRLFTRSSMNKNHYCTCTLLAPAMRQEIEMHATDASLLANNWGTVQKWAVDPQEPPVNLDYLRTVSMQGS